jgi:uncharacterized membrane protein
MRCRRPVLDIPFTLTDRVVAVIGLIGAVLLVALPVFAWSGLPDEVPIHFGISGDPTSWADRWMIWFLPALGLITTGSLAVLARYPHVYNFPVPATDENAPHLYRLSRSMVIWLAAEIAVCFAFIEWTMLRTATGKSEGLVSIFVPVYLVLVFGTIGYFMFKTFKVR